MSTASIIGSGERDRWRDAAVDSFQSFPATGSFNLEENAFGLLLVHNDDVVSPGEGFDMHYHQDQEIVSWIVDGAVRHRDSGATESSIITSGMAQHISAGSGVRHSETNAAGYTSRQPARIVQSWLPADALGTIPSHRSADFSEALSSGAFIQVAGPDSPLPLGTTGAAMWVARLNGTPQILQGSAFVHFYVISGTAQVNERQLDAGDTLRATDIPELSVEGQGEVLVWVMDRAIQN